MLHIIVAVSTNGLITEGTGELHSWSRETECCLLKWPVFSQIASQPYW